MSAREQRIGRLSGSYAVLAPLLIASQAVLSLSIAPVLSRVALDPKSGWLLGGSVLAELAFLVFAGVPVALQQHRRPARSRGRARLLLSALTGIAHALAVVGGGAIMARPATLQALRIGLDLQAPRGLAGALTASIAVGGLAGLTCLCACISCFWLVPPHTRARIWVVVDVALLVAVAWAVAFLPTQPPASSSQALALPVLRHVLTALGALRLLFRMMPSILTWIESAGFQPLVAARHLRSKKSGFLATISILSVGAVALSCIALTTTLSVMGGFRNDLKRKILGNNAHIVIDRDTGRIEDWEPMLSSIAGAPHVIGASPYVSGEVMLSSASNLATGVLRGIDPARIGKVNDLPRNLTSGKLEYLEHPDKLLEAPVGDLRDSPLLFGKGKLIRVGRHDAGVGTSVSADAGTGRAAAVDAGVGESRAIAARGDAGAALGQIGAGETPARKRARSKLDLEKRLESLEAFLRDSAEPSRKEEDRQLLPGIIIGQELARALRLYVGDEVNVVAPLGALGPSGPMPKSRPFRVAGIFYSGMYEYDMKFTYVALETAQKFLGTGNEISGVEVRVREIERAPETAAAIRGALPDKTLRVRDWQELNSRLFGALALEKLAMFVALGIAILVASFCIAGTLTLMVQEKGREVAILKAMGTSDRTVVGVFVIEGGLIGVLGASLGLFFGYMVCFAAEHFGIRMNPEVYYIDRLPVHIDAAEFSLTGLAAVVVCLIITIYPALLASRLRPVEALRYE